MNDFPAEHGDFHGFCRFPSRFFHRDSPAFDVELLIFMCVEVKIPPISSSIPLFWGSIHFCCSFHQYMEGKKHVFAEKKIQKNHQLKTYFLLVFPHFSVKTPIFPHGTPAFLQPHGARSTSFWHFAVSQQRQHLRVVFLLEDERSQAVAKLVYIIVHLYRIPSINICYINFKLVY